MSLKTIKVNPIFLATSGSSVKNKTRKEKPLGASLGQSNNIKKKLIARIKNFQQNNKKEQTNVSVDNTFKDDFSESMQFLDELAKDKQEHKLNKHNATLKKKQKTDPNAYMQIATELPPELQWSVSPPASAQAQQIQAQQIQAQQIQAQPIQAQPTISWIPPPQPLYSSLKNSSKPTYRTWLRTTQKNKPTVNKPPINILEDIALVEPLPTAAVAVAGAGIAGIAAVAAVAQPIAAVAPTASAVAPLPLYTPSLPRRKKITRTFKYKLGKHANGKVSVLIKNAQTRRNVQTEHAQLKRKSILDVKNHLRSKNLLKVGSNAPNDVLREIYEQSILAGQVENKAKDTLIHNYFNGDK